MNECAVNSWKHCASLRVQIHPKLTQKLGEPSDEESTLSFILLIYFRSVKYFFLNQLPNNQIRFLTF